MTKRAWITLCLALLLATSGCVGVLGGPSDATPTRETTTATTEAGDTTTTEAATSTTDDGDDGGEGESRSPAYDAVANHEERLRSAGSFTGTLVQNQTGGRSGNVTMVVRVDLADDQYVANVTGVVSGMEMTAQRYTTDDETYQRVTLGSREQTGMDTKPYEGNVEPVNVSEAMGGPDFRRQVGKIDLERDGTATFRGQEMRKFTARGPDAWDVSRPTGVAEVTGFEMTLLVDDRGIARVVEYTLKGTTEAGGDFHQFYRLEITDVGSTDVEKPGWTEDVASALVRR